MQLDRCLDDRQTRQHVVYPLLGGPELSEDVITAEQAKVLRAIEWDIENHTGRQFQLGTQRVANASRRREVFHHTAVRDRLKCAFRRDRLKVEHVTNLERDVLAGPGLARVSPRLRHDIGVEINSEHLVAKRRGTQRVTPWAATQFQDLASARDTTGQQAEKSVVSGDPMIDHVRRQVPNATLLKYADPSAGIRRFGKIDRRD